MADFVVKNFCRLRIWIQLCHSFFREVPDTKSRPSTNPLFFVIYRSDFSENGSIRLTISESALFSIKFVCKLRNVDFFLRRSSYILIFFLLQVDFQYFCARTNILRKTQAAINSHEKMSPQRAFDNFVLIPDAKINTKTGQTGKIIFRRKSKVS